MPHGQIADDKIRIGLVLPKDLKKDLTIIASADDRSLNAMICRILAFYRNQYFEEHPELKTKEKRRKTKAENKNSSVLSIKNDKKSPEKEQM